MTGIPWLGASASRTFRGITASKTCAPKNPRRSAATCLERVVLSSYIVSRMPSMASDGLIARRSLASVSRSSETPSSARNSHWTGTMTASAAARALIVRISSDGGQSIRMKSYFSRSGWIICLSRYSRSSIEMSSTAAPTRFLSDGIRSSRSICASIVMRSTGSPRISA